MKINIVAVHGNLGAGKDSIYQSIFRNLGYKIYAFSDPIYSFAKMQFDIRTNKDVNINKHHIFKKYIEICGGVSRADFDKAYSFVTEILPQIAEENDLYKDVFNGRKPRKFLQALGTGYVRKNISKDAWANYLKNTVIKDITANYNEYIESLEKDEVNLRLIGNLNNAQVVVNNNSEDFINKIFISDVRFIDEITSIVSLKQNIKSLYPEAVVSVKLIKLKVSKEVSVQRLIERDGFTKEEILESLEHESEKTIDDSLFDLLVDADKDPKIIRDFILANIGDL